MLRAPGSWAQRLEGSQPEEGHTIWTITRSWIFPQLVKLGKGIFAQEENNSSTPEFQSHEIWAEDRFCSFHDLQNYERGPGACLKTVHLCWFVIPLRKKLMQELRIMVSRVLRANLSHHLKKASLWQCIYGHNKIHQKKKIAHSTWWLPNLLFKSEINVPLWSQEIPHL